MLPRTRGLESAYKGFLLCGLSGLLDAVALAVDMNDLATVIRNTCRIPNTEEEASTFPILTILNATQK
ncbi:hypothetical protein C4900_11140 [Acidiferrobacter thiooxydans]|uniref:Uncharacterized protein n=1 Tax=Acidiferrobacter thiooxydans TaxID=163359 RepID=A0A1C2FX52_9GAMM|nr:hypothetical protein C4900_11140 [Acidiferrobacter thiooxydans]